MENQPKHSNFEWWASVVFCAAGYGFIVLMVIWEFVL